MITCPFYKIRSDSDRSAQKIVTWRGGLSWMVAAWFLWLPSALIYVFCEPTSLTLSDILNPALLYWGMLGLGFVSWTCADRCREGFVRNYDLNLFVYAQSFQAINCKGEGVRTVREYLDAIFFTNLGNDGFSAFKLEHLDDRFKSAVAREKRHSSIGRSIIKATKRHQKVHNPYAKPTSRGTYIVMICSGLLPFILRKINGDDIFGTTWEGILCDVLLGILTIWEWWCLVEITYRKIEGFVGNDIKLGKSFVQHTAQSNFIKSLNTHNIYKDIANINAHEVSNDGIQSNRDLQLEITGENVYAFYSAYISLGKQVTDDIISMQCLIQDLFVMQLLCTATFVSTSIFAPKYISVKVIGYVLYETTFILAVLLSILTQSVKINKFDDEVVELLRETVIMLANDEERNEDRIALEAIALYLEKHHVFEAKLFGVRISAALVAKIMGSFLAATFSAVLRIGI
mmetsp:Transcript_15473/g.31875  ORF Transcript_15473/g.31875 Transcript_15473/m.31875 type:complete len:458 (-) Transcript_15473:29-1402(-)